MKVEPKIRQNICLTANPSGCALRVREQINYVRARDAIEGPNNVLVIGSSNGYGLDARIVSAFGSGAATVGVSLERPGTAGWYNTKAFEQEAERAGLSAWSINGDAFSPEVKDQAIELIRDKLGMVDLIVYSIAAPRRIDPEIGQIYSSVIKPIIDKFTSKTVDIQTGALSEITAEPATQGEIEHTIKVMGGEDWYGWISAMKGREVLTENATPIAFSYLGSTITDPIYREGTIGRAKLDLEKTARHINHTFTSTGIRAIISVNKALVTRASAVIPAFTLYISLLYRVIEQKGIHEGCIQQMYRLFHDYLYAERPGPTDDQGRIRLDDLEMREDVQREVVHLWKEVDAKNIKRLSDIDGFREEFLKHHGFGMEGVDYSEDVDL